ncbi:MAG: AhpC/TSA family protein [Planctomycetaceae bacterium]|nr:AhpC/TSA family protein [Planctomycetaceae bacterium]
MGGFLQVPTVENRGILCHASNPFQLYHRLEETIMLKFLSFAFALCTLQYVGNFPAVAVADDIVIAAAPEKTSPLKVGQQVPELTLTSTSSEGVSLSSLHKDKPVVLVFFRGGWCPICSRHTAELIKAYPEIQKLGAELVAISPDSAESSKANIEKNSIPFAVYSDSKVQAAGAFGLAFKVDDATVTKYKGFGIDLEKASGQPHHALPIPAVYIVDKSGKITFAHSNPDYRQRLETKTIIAELQKLN